MNIYPVIITDKATEVGYARWGNNAQARANEDATQMKIYARARGEFIYETKFVTAKTRKEVVENYEV